MATVLMLCHDQNLDRRVVAQAVSLIKRGHRVRLLAFALDASTSEEITPEGIELTRIGLSCVVPDNPTYIAYSNRQTRLNNLLKSENDRLSTRDSILRSSLALARRINRYSYRAMLVVRYRNVHMHDPLPFRLAFLSHAPSAEPDIVQVHDLPALQAGIELANRWRVPLVYDAHELYPEQHAFSSVQRRVCTIAEGYGVHQADLIFAVNESIADEMARRYTVDRPIVLSNAIDPHASFDPEYRYDIIRQKLNLGAERRILLYQGGFSPNRNLKELVVAMQRVRAEDIDLVLIGFGEFGELLKATAARLSLLNKRVHFLPAVPQSDLLQHSASADLGIIPYPHVDLNSYYCTPNKLFEFIQAGLPVLANDSPELRRFVLGNDFGMVHPMTSPAEIAQAIDLAFERMNFTSWKKSVTENRPRFSWQVQEAIYISHFERLLKPGRERKDSSPSSTSRQSADR